MPMYLDKNTITSDEGFQNQFFLMEIDESELIMLSTGLELLLDKLKRRIDLPLEELAVYRKVYRLHTVLTVK